MEKARRGATSLRRRNRAATTVLVSEQKALSDIILAPAQKLPGIV